MEIFDLFRSNISSLVMYDEMLLNRLIYKLSGRSCIYFTSEEDDPNMALVYIRVLIYWMYIQLIINFIYKVFAIFSYYYNLL